MRTKISILFILLPLIAFCKSYDKEFIKLIQKHDVPVCARNLPSGSGVKDFWDKVLEENAVLLNLVSDISKAKGAEKEALSSVSRMALYDYKLDVEILPSFKGFCDTLVMDMGLPGKLFELNVIYDPSPNAFTVLTKGGFAICLNTGLLEKLDYDYFRIMAITAHEFVHGALFHHLRNEYAVAKKERKDKLLGGIAAGLNGISQVADAYTSGITGKEYDPHYYEQVYDKIKEDLALSSFKFRYKYSREEELEADLIALRFMQFLGKGKKLTEALQMITGSREYFFSEYEESDHPSTAYRVEFLNFVTENPQFMSTVVAKKKKEKKYTKSFDPIYE